MPYRATFSTLRDALVLAMQFQYHSSEPPVKAYPAGDFVLRTWRQLKRSWYIFFFQLPWLPERLLARHRCAAIGRMFRGMAVDKSRFPDEDLRVYRQAAAAPGELRAMINYYRALIRGLGRLGRRGNPRIEIPTLVIWGEVDHTGVGVSDEHKIEACCHEAA